MTSASTPAAAATARRLSPRTLAIWIVVLSLLGIAGVIVTLAIGGRPDPAALRAVAPQLDGPWRFHPGDDPRWAEARLDDSQWETLDLSAPAGSIDGDVGLPNYLGGWMEHGHPGYQGYAWYRRMVTVPAGDKAWDILGPTAVDDGYELYWNGKLLGGSGRLGDAPRMVGTRPLIYALPAGAAGSTGVLAIRVFMQPSPDFASNGGGIHVAPALAPQPQSHELHRVQWWRSIAGYIVELIEPLAMFALIALALATRSRSSHPRFIGFVCIALVLSAMNRLDNAIVSWTDLMSLPTYAWLSKVIWTPLSLAAWTLAWNRWNERPLRIVDGAALVLAVVGVAAGALHLVALTRPYRLAFLALQLVVFVRVIGQGPLRAMATITMALLLISQFTGELRAIGVPEIWFPFGIGVTLVQYIYAIAIPLLALLIVRTLDSKSAR